MKLHIEISLSNFLLLKDDFNINGTRFAVRFPTLFTSHQCYPGFLRHTIRILNKKLESPLCSSTCLVDERKRDKDLPCPSPPRAISPGSPEKKRHCENLAADRSIRRLVHVTPVQRLSAAPNIAASFNLPFSLSSATALPKSAEIPTNILLDLRSAPPLLAVFCSFSNLLSFQVHLFQLPRNLPAREI